MIKYMLYPNIITYLFVEFTEIPLQASLAPLRDDRFFAASKQFHFSLCRDSQGFGRTPMNVRVQD
jgi:hypothetical protein